jgi:RNA polymerase sigma factor (sigma-70 family)
VLAWRRIASFRGDASFRTWLLTIAWHQAINRRRALVRWWKRTVPFEDEAIVPLRPWLKPDTTYASAAAAAGTETDGAAKNRRRPWSDGSPVASSGASAGISQATHVASGFPASLRYGEARRSAERGGGSRILSDQSGFSRSAGRTPEQLVSSHELRRDIVKSIRALSPKLRDTLLLTQSGDYTYAEIGTMLHAPIGTIKWRVVEARRLVKKRLQELGHGELG